MQLTQEVFCQLMKSRTPFYGETGLRLIWQEYEKDAIEMPDEDIRIDLDTVSQVFRKIPLRFFAQENNMEYRDTMDDSEFANFKEEVKNLLGNRFLGFTEYETVLLRS